MKKVTTDLVEQFDCKHEHGKYVGILTVGDKEFRQELPENIGEMSVKKQEYWMQKTIKQLKARSKQDARLELAKEVRKHMAARRVKQECETAAFFESIGVERVEQ